MPSKDEPGKNSILFYLAQENSQTIISLFFLRCRNHVATLPYADLIPINHILLLFTPVHSMTNVLAFVFVFFSLSLISNRYAHSSFFLFLFATHHTHTYTYLFILLLSLYINRIQCILQTKRAFATNVDGTRDLLCSITRDFAMDISIGNHSSSKANKTRSCYVFLCIFSSSLLA